MIRVALLAFLLLASSTPARADPISAAILGFLGIGASATAVAVTTFLLSTAASIGVGLLQRALQKKPDTRDPGIQLQVEVGDDSPIGFVMGTGATAGSRRYVGSCGKSGGTPNAFFVDVIQVGDLPAPGQPGVWANDVTCTILWDEPDEDGRGYPVEEFRIDGKDHLWVRYRDGTETTADTWLLDKFAADPDRPWKTDMIGRGCPHLIFTARFNRELFPGQMTWLIEPPPIALYDLRKDSTAGGSGDHRWDDPSTWEPSDNLALMSYNVARGIYYDDGAGYREWMYGGQGLPAFRLPAANWMAAANECDVEVAKQGGGTEKQFRGGLEIRGDIEPLTAIEEFLKGCNGRLAEVGGIFKTLVGAPGSAVYAFTDDDVIITEGQSLRPFPSLEDTHNGIEATYPEPAERWASKDAPARYSDVYEEADGDRHLVVSVNLAAVPFDEQVQRLMKAIIESARRFRIHAFHLPPAAWLLDPAVDSVSWTSARNGYTDKKFLIVRIAGEPTMNQAVVLLEFDPADFDYDPETDTQPTSTGFLGPIRPPAQPMTGWQAIPATFTAGGIERPTVQVSFDGDLDDVEYVRVQARLTETLASVFDGTLPYGEPDQPTRDVVLNAVFLPATEYQVRGRFLPFTPRPTDWSSWLDVTTPDTRLTEAEFSNQLDALLDQLRTETQASVNAALEDIRAQVESLAQQNGGAYAVTEQLVNAIVTSVGQQVGENKASVTTLQEAVASGQGALAQYFVGLLASTAEGEAETLLRFVVSATAADAVASFAVEVRATVEDAFAEAGIFMDVGAFPNGASSRIRLKADQFAVDNGAGGTVPLVVTGGDVYLQNLKIQSENGVVALELDADRIVFTEPA